MSNRNAIGSIACRPTSSLRCGILIAMVLLVGCDDFPGIKPPQLTASADTVNTRGRRGYDWNVRLGRFEVARPTEFKFVEQLDPQELRAKLDVPDFAEPTQPARPDWMSDEVYSRYRRYSEPHWKPNTLFEVDLGNAADARACMNSDGTRMVVATDKLVEWDLNTGKRLHTCDLPLESAIPIGYDNEGDSILLYNSDEVLSMGIADGAVLQRWRTETGKIVSAVRAREADVVAVVTEGNQLLAITERLTHVIPYRGDQLDTPRVAVHPKGNWILGILPNGYVRWHLNQAGYPAETTTPVHAMVNAGCIPVCGARFDRLVDPYFFYEEGPGTAERASQKSRTPNFQPNLICRNAVAATTDGSQDWLVVLGDRGDFHDNIQTYIQDFSLQSMRYSLPWEIPYAKAKILTSDWSVERIAFQVDNTIKVVERRAWVDPTGLNLFQSISRMFREGRIEEVESLAELLRSQKLHRFGKTGEDMFALCVQHLGTTWSNMENESVDDEIADKIARWHDAGSELAKLASIQRHIYAGASARGSKGAADVTAQGWKELDRHMTLAQEEIQQLLSSNQVSVALLDSHIVSAKHANISIEDCGRYLQNSIELSPQSTSVAVSFCSSLLPRWGGTAGEGGAVVGAIADLYPADAGDVFYARTALGLYALYGPTILEPSEAGFSVTRIFYGSATLLEKGMITRREAELTMALARAAGKLELIDELAKYHLQHFGLIGDEGFRTDILVKLHEMRSLALPENYDPLN